MFKNRGKCESFAQVLIEREIIGLYVEHVLVPNKLIAYKIILKLQQNVLKRVTEMIHKKFRGYSNFP